LNILKLHYIKWIKPKKNLLYRLNDKNLPNFNIPKLYIISHYLEIIYIFSILMGIIIEHGERAYIFLKKILLKIK